MTKKYSRIIAVIMLVIAIVFIFIALNNPQASFPWSNTITYFIYAVYILIMVLLFAVMYFILIRPQKKKDKEAKAMQSSLQVGDEIVTIGGIVGLVVQVNEDNIVIETTGNRNKIRLKNWAVQENLTMTENAKRKQEAQIAAAKEKRAGKKKKKDSDDSDQGMLKD